MSQDKNNQAPRTLTTITVQDKRGTKIAVTLYIGGPMLHDYIKEVMRVWSDEWCGEPDHIYVHQSGPMGGDFEWIKPGELKEQQPHQP